MPEHFYELRTEATYTGPHPTVSVPRGSRPWVSHFASDADAAGSIDDRLELRRIALDWLARLKSHEDDVNTWGDTVAISRLNYFTDNGFTTEGHGGEYCFTVFADEVNASC